MMSSLICKPSRSARRIQARAGFSKPGHRQRNFQLVAGPDDDINFTIYQRQSERDDDDFSCGIALLPPSAARLTLARYNGPSHPHGEILFRPRDGKGDRGRQEG